MAALVFVQQTHDNVQRSSAWYSLAAGDPFLFYGYVILT